MNTHSQKKNNKKKQKQKTAYIANEAQINEEKKVSSHLGVKLCLIERNDFVIGARRIPAEPLQTQC